MNKTRLGVRFSHWLSGFLVHVVFSIVSLGVAIKEWDKDCSNDNDLQITGSGWLIISEVFIIIYALFLIPCFLLWEMHPGKRIRYAIILDIYSVLVIFSFTLFFIGWDLLGMFLLFEEIYKCKGSGVWVMSVISIVRAWVHFMYPVSIIIMRGMEEHFSKEMRFPWIKKETS